MLFKILLELFRVCVCTRKCTCSRVGLRSPEVEKLDPVAKQEAEKKLVELKRRRNETESEEIEKMKQKQQTAEAELEELKKKREERRKILEEEEKQKKQEQAEKKAKEEVYAVVIPFKKNCKEECQCAMPSIVIKTLLSFDVAEIHQCNTLIVN